MTNDIIAAAGLLCFTSFELIFLQDATLMNYDTWLEILSKLGIIGILWLWLKDLKKQMEEQRKVCKEELEELKATYNLVIDGLQKSVEAKDVEVNRLQERIQEILLNNNE